MKFYDNTAVVATACNACKSSMGMDGGMGGEMGGNLATSTKMMPIRSVLMGATRLSYDAGRDGAMTVEKVARDLADLDIPNATEDAVKGAARFVKGAGDNAVRLVKSVLPNNLKDHAKKVTSMFKTMKMR